MKTNKWLLVVLVMLAGATVYVMTTRKKSTLKGELRDFAIKDTAAITKIFLADRNGNHVTLERKTGGPWLLDKTDEPKLDQVRNLLDCFYRIEVRSPVAKAAYNNVLKVLATSAIKCEVYLNGDSVPAKVYYVGGQTEDDLGTFMMLENSSMPFITYIPGFNGYLTPRFAVKMEDWKSNIIFGYKKDKIKSVLVNYANAPERSFLIYRDNDRYYAMNPNSNQFIQQIDTAAVENYLYQYSGFYYEAPVRQNQRDTLRLEPATVRISVKNVDNQIKELEIYPYPLTKRSMAQTDSTGAVLRYDLDRVYGLILPENHLVFVQQQQLNRILRQLTDFDLNKPAQVRKR